uniref:Uncharacterized protein n=1 Tax=Avena sativa TaxID=4498 RepID=A0ACD5WAG8_AVESA
MAASDTQEGGASAAGRAGQDDAPEPQRELVAAGEQTASDDAPVAPGASVDEEEGEAVEADAPEPLRELDAAGEQAASDHAPVAPAAAEDEEVARGVVEAEQDDAPELEEEQEVEEGGQEMDADATEQDGEGEGGEDGEEDEEDAPTHLPFAPTDEELLDDTTTVDPSYTISLIRKLIPKGSNLDKEFSDKQSANSDDGESSQPDNKDPSEKGDKQSANSDDGKSTQPDNRDPSEKSDRQGFPEERSVSSNDGESTLPEYKDQWEECGCILWDLAASEPQAELMIDNSVLEVLLENLRVTDSSRVKEVCLGIMGNLACHESLVDAICLEKGLIATVVQQLFLDDVSCLSETFRLLAAILRSTASVSWAEALLPDEILSRILWILGNTANLTLLEKSIDFISTVMDIQDMIAMLIQPLLKAGLVDHVIGLLISEIEKSQEEKLDRSGSLDMILHFMEELSAIHSVSEVMSSSDRLMEVLVSMIKSPDKHEVASYCASVVIIISNILTDGKHLVPMLSHDLPFLEGLFDILPLVPDDDQARYALWCTLPRILPEGQETEMNSSSLGQFASLFLGKFTLVKDDLESHVVDKENLSSEDALVMGWTSKCLRAISFVMERWIEEKSSQSNQDAPLTGNSIDSAREVLSYCHKALH